MASNYHGAREASQVAMPAVTVDEDVVIVPASTTQLLTNPGGKKLLYLVESGGVAFKVLPGDHTSGGLPANAVEFDPTRFGPALVLSAPDELTIETGAASTVATWWAD